MCDWETLVSDVNAIDFKTSVAICFNVASSISIILVNKSVFDFLDYNFATTVTFIHFVCTFLGLLICWWMNMFQAKLVPLKHIMPLALSFCGFVVLTNLSLQYNSVGFYQIAKVGTTPTVVVIETLWFGKSYSMPTKLALLPVCLGVIITSATDMQFNVLGASYAFLGVIVTSLYQIWVGSKQKELGLDSMQLLFNQAPISAAMLIFVIPFFDDVQQVMDYPYDVSSVSAILVTGVLAFCVNLSIFLVIGKTSAVTYNVVGYFKLALVVLGGFLLFQYEIVLANILGITLTLVGVVMYTHIKLQETARQQAAAAAAAAASISANVNVPLEKVLVVNETESGEDGEDDKLN